MGFLSPISLLFMGFLAVLIAFYFFKKQFHEKVVSSTYFWDQIMKEWEINRWHKRLNQNILLLLQLLIMLAIILALTRPFSDDEKLISSDHLVIIIDSSASMLAIESNGSRFEIAKKQAIHLIKDLNKEQSVTLIHAKKIPELLVVNATDHHKVIQLINQLEISFEAENMKDSLKLAESILYKKSAEIHLFSDHVRIDTIDELPIQHNILVHNIGTMTGGNLSIQSFGVKKSGTKAVNGILTLYNQSLVEREVSIEISNEEEIIEVVNTTVKADTITPIELKDLKKSTVYKARIIGSDPYILDNELYSFLASKEEDTVYLVGDVNSFVRKALQAFGTKMVSIPQNKDGTFTFPDQRGIYLLANVPSDLWPVGPKIVISPVIGGPFHINEKQDLQYTLKSIQDPILQYVDVGSLYLAKGYPIGELQEMEPLITSGENVIVAKGFFKGDPTIVFSLDFQDSDWPLHPSFPILFNNSLDFLTTDRVYIGKYLPGEIAEVNFSSTTVSAQIVNAEGMKLQEVNLNNKSMQLPSEPGLYQLIEKVYDGTLTRYFVIELEESERTIITEDSFSMKVENEGNNSFISGIHEYWRWFAVLALLLLFVEWEVYRRGIGGR